MNTGLLGPTRHDNLDRPWEIEVGKMGRSEMLARWINHMRCKKKLCERRCNYRMRAMLQHAVKKAEDELQRKQLSRVRRWKAMRKYLLKDVNYGSCHAFNLAQQEYERREQLAKEDVRRIWQQENMCEDLGSLDDFLQQFCSRSSRCRFARPPTPDPRSIEMQF